MSIRDYIAVYGQSLSTAYTKHTPEATPTHDPALTLTALEGTNVQMLGLTARQRSDGLNTNALPAITSMNPLVEFAYQPFAYTGSGVALTETICSGMAYWLYQQIESKLLAVANGHGGLKITQLSKGTGPYNNLLSTYGSAKNLIEADGDTLRVPAVAFLQGESDEINDEMALYAARLATLRSDFETDLTAAIGAHDPVPWFIEQFSSFWAARNKNDPTYHGLPESPEIILGIHEDNADIRIVTPTYPFNFSDDFHLHAESYRRLGEYFGRAIHEHVFLSQPWECLRPVAITRTGSAIDIEFTGNNGPLVADTDLVPDAGNLGFTVTVEGRLVRVVDAHVKTDNVVRLVLATPTPAGETKVFYGFPLWDASRVTGKDHGPRGNLRDSIAPESRFGYPNLYKWCVHFARVATGTS